MESLNLSFSFFSHRRETQVHHNAHLLVLRRLSTAMHDCAFAHLDAGVRQRGEQLAAASLILFLLQ